MSDGISASLLELRVGQIGRKDEDFEVKKSSQAKRTSGFCWTVMWPFGDLSFQV